MGRICWLTSLLLMGTGCVGPGMLTDGTTVSVGTHSRGALRHGVRLPVRGEGYVVPQRWQERQRNYGTEELVSLIVRSARHVGRRHRGGLLGVADLSPLGGGATPEHRSHHSGRDVDLIFYSTDLRGKPLAPTEMINFDGQGLSLLPEPEQQAAGAARPDAGTAAEGPPAPAAPASQPAAAEPRRKLDLARNWALIKVLVTDPQVPVQWIFVGRPIIRLLLRYAKKKQEPAYILQRAEQVLHQPSDAQSHMDHMHVRIFCSLADRRLGCIDRGPPRWFKKDIKYVDMPPVRPELPRQVALLPLRVMRLRGL
jgi:penicillin-insensitive murein endopeptidase